MKTKKEKDKGNEQCKKYFSENIENLYHWIGHVQEGVSLHRIAKHRTLSSWIYQILFDYKVARLNDDEDNRKSKNPYDGILNLAINFGLIIFAWGMRCSLAKCYDPRRTAKARNDAFLSFLFSAAKVKFIIDPKINEYDKKIFNQPWQATMMIKKYIATIFK